MSADFVSLKLKEGKNKHTRTNMFINIYEEEEQIINAIVIIC